MGIFNNKVSCPHCSKTNSANGSLFGNNTCQCCSKRFAFACNIYTQNYQTFREPASHKTTKNLRRYLYIVERGRCHYCHKPIQFDNTTVDHIHPKSKGGILHPSNAVISCNKCNQAKHSMSYDDFISMFTIESKKQKTTLLSRLISFGRKLWIK